MSVRKKYKAIHLGPSTKGPQNLFITVLASIMPLPVAEWKTAGAFIRELKHRMF